jgi:putative NADH-flavin reductase
LKIAVIGSTGGTGLEVIKQGIQRDHVITTLARHPEKLEGISGINSTIKGDALNFKDVRRTIEGQDVVISVLGTPEPARNIIESMKQTRISRGIWVSAWPITGTKPWFLVKLTWLLFGTHYRKLREMERLVMNSDIDWTIVRPPRLTNGERTGNVRIERRDEISTGPYSISRADLAGVLLDEAEFATDVRRGIYVTELPKGSKKEAATGKTVDQNLQH